MWDCDASKGGTYWSNVVDEASDLGDELWGEETEDGVEEAGNLLDKIWGEKTSEAIEEWAKVAEKVGDGADESLGLVGCWLGEEVGGVVNEALDVVEGLGVEELEESWDETGQLAEEVANVGDLLADLEELIESASVELDWRRLWCCGSVDKGREEEGEQDLELELHFGGCG